jgi:endonuclease/exonuclease/phosphatase family metal-dependent hydrolase
MRLSGYSRVGVGRDDGIDQGEFTPIMYLDDRFLLLDSGNFWLSETPAVPSLGWDALIKRICTFAILQDRLSGTEIHVYNTHFSHVGSEARLKSAELIMDSIAAKSQDARIILTGDLNTEPGSSPYNVIIENGLRDSYESDLRLGPKGTFNGFTLTGTYDRRIDYVFFMGFDPEYYTANSMVIDNQYLSDHFPVITMLKYHSGK